MIRPVLRPSRKAELISSITCVKYYKLMVVNGLPDITTAGGVDLAEFVCDSPIQRSHDWFSRKAKKVVK